MDDETGQLLDALRGKRIAAMNPLTWNPPPRPGETGATLGGSAPPGPIAPARPVPRPALPAPPPELSSARAGDVAAPITEAPEKPKKIRRLSRRFTPQERAKAILLVSEEGLSLRAAAVRVGASPAAVCQWVKKAGLVKFKIPSELEVLRARVDELERRLPPSQPSGVADLKPADFEIPAELDYLKGVPDGTAEGLGA